MEIHQIKDKSSIQKFLLQDPYLHIYEMGDLQDKLFKHITWHAALEKGEIKALGMLYMTREPLFFLLEDKNHDAAKALAENIAGILPEKAYCHLSKGLSAILGKTHDVEMMGNFLKMKLTGDILVDQSIRYPEYTYRMNTKDFEIINEYLKKVNPKAFFVHGMLDYGKYFCIRKNNEIISMAGVHLYSEEYGIAAIGNIVTDEKYRGRGFAKSVTASLCRDIWGRVKYIGLNVRSDNTAAIRAYERIGFVKHSECEEVRVRLK
jgi:predicted GNAT family acetyltransferase